MDGKNFTDALRDFDSALRLLPPDAGVDRARLLSGGSYARPAAGGAAPSTLSLGLRHACLTSRAYRHPPQLPHPPTPTQRTP